MEDFRNRLFYRRCRGFNHFNLLSVLHLTKGGGPKVVKVLLVEALVTLPADGFLELLYLNGRCFNKLALLGGGRATLELGAPFTEFLDSLVGNGLDPADLLPIRLARGRERDHSAGGKRMRGEDEVGLAAGFEISVAIGVLWARLALRLNEWNSPVGKRNIRGQ